MFNPLVIKKYCILFCYLIPYQFLVYWLISTVCYINFNKYYLEPILKVPCYLINFLNISEQQRMTYHSHKLYPTTIFNSQIVYIRYKVPYIKKFKGISILWKRLSKFVHYVCLLNYGI